MSKAMMYWQVEGDALNRMREMHDRWDAVGRRSQ